MTLFNDDEIVKPKRKSRYTQQQAYEDFYSLIPEEWCKDELFEISADDWMEARMTGGKPYKTKVGVRKFVNRLLKLSDGDINKAIELMDFAIEKGWDTVWEHGSFKGREDKTKVQAVKGKYDHLG